MTQPCTRCDGTMLGKRERVRFHGLDGIVVDGVPVYRCRKCGEREEVFERILDLTRVVVMTLAKHWPQLGAREIRFLRTYLGLSSSAFARKMRVERETVSRWETGKRAIGPQAELLLRLIVLSEKPVDEYRPEPLEREATPPRPILVKRARAGWKEQFASHASQSRAP